jgi:hypothetical protein
LEQIEGMGIVKTIFWVAYGISYTTDDCIYLWSRDIIVYGQVGTGEHANLREVQAEG